MHKKLFSIFSLVLVLAVAFSAVSPVAAQPSLKADKGGVSESPNGLYIVQMLDMPVVTYGGEIKGLKATAPKKGDKINPNSPDVVAYVSYLNSKHDAVLAKVGGQKVYDYNYSFNGFAAKLTAAQANKLIGQDGIVAVTPDEIRKLDTSTTPAFLGLNAAGGLWSQLSGNADGNPIIAKGPNSGGAGEGVIVGIVDSGIWPENPSFIDRDAEGKLVYQQLSGWHGKCVPGEEFAGSDCNQKLIGAQWFGEGFGGPDSIKEQFPYEFISARGASGHGSHTASTAAGNYNVAALIDGVNLGQISGMAPRARIAVYKVCWGIGDEGGCPNSDSVAAIDQAVADGVDVINFSISGSLNNFLDPVEVAFLFAADAGVFVAASAGNSGPNASTVAHNSPWLTTVAAGSHDRQYTASATLGNGVTYFGAGLGAAVPSLPLILSDNAGLAGADPAKLALCYGTVDGAVTLDPAKVAGKIVVCDRGVTARVNKSLAVQEAGGIGMILVNVTPATLNADFHYVPTVHLQNTDRAAVRTYAALPGATASLAQGVGGGGALAPDVASFSSRGPALAGGGDLLKPDIMAPGVDVLAAVSPIEGGGRNYDFYSGTSMSSPHMAGLAALMKQKYPTWSPAAIKSAFMTTASQSRNNGTPIPGNPFGFGAGQVVPNSAANPGLVYNAGWTDWLGFLCGTGQLTASYCPSIRIDPSNLNYPSIAIGDLAGEQTVIRKVTNVTNSPATYTASVSGLTGIAVQVTPASLTIGAGKTESFTVKFTRTTAAINSYSFGALTWSDGSHVVRSPIAVRPVALAVPASIYGNGQQAINYSVTYGYTGSFTASPRGLVPATTTPGTVEQDPDQTFDPADPAGTVAIPVTIPAGTTYARFALFDIDVAADSDIDLYVYQGATLVGSSSSGTSAEEVNFSFATPTAAPMNLTVYVHGWGLPAGSSAFVLNSFYVGNSAAGNMSVIAPTTATLGQSGTIQVTFSGLTPATRYLGSIYYSGSAGMPVTIVNITTP